MGFVVDASICAKWFFLEEHDDLAHRLLLSGDELKAPELVLSEFGNIVWKRRLRGELSELEARRTLDAFRGTRLQRQPVVGLMDQAVAMGVALRHSFYDCLYLALAEREGVPMITADRRLRNKTAGTPYASLILWIGDLP